MLKSICRRGLIVFPACCALPDHVAAQQLLWEWTGPAGRAYNDGYGSFVSFLGDVDGDGVVDALIGAHREDQKPGKETGAIHVVSGRTGVDLYTKSGDRRDSYFGAPVSGGVDADGDGVGDFIVGCNNYWDITGFGFGAAYVYSGNTGSLLYDLYGENDGDGFGFYVEMLEDVDGDGRGDFVVTAVSYFVPPSAGSAGKVYVYSGKTGQLLYSKTGTASYEFMSIACQLGDINGDGIRDLGVGAFGWGAGSNGQGRFDILDGPTGTLLYSVEGEDYNDSFANSAAGLGDINADGIDDFFVSAPNHIENPGPGKQPEGRVYVYSGATGAVLYQYDGVADWEGMGQAPYSGTGDINDDGWPDIVFGSGRRPTSPTGDAGVMLAYSGRTGCLLYEFNLQSGEPISGNLGGSSSFVGDMNLDGIDDVMAGAPNKWTNGQSGAGHVFVFAGNDLFLQSNAYSFLQGDTATLEIRGGEPGVLGLFVVTDVSGTPMFVPLLIAPLDANGNLQLTGSVPTGLTGLSATFMGYAQKASGHGLIDSIPEMIVFN